MFGISGTSSQCIFVFVYLCICICVFVFAHLCICQSRILFSMSWDHWLFKNISLLGISGTFSHAVFVYLRICICVFMYLTVQNIIFDVLVSLAFQKYKYVGYFRHFLTCCICVFAYLYLCICVFAYLYLCICVFDSPEYNF